MKNLLWIVLVLFVACKSNSQKVNSAKAEETAKEVVEQASEVKSETVTEERKFEITKTDEEWKSELSEFEYYVIREKGTERAFSGQDLLKNQKEGVYTCRACENELFTHETKFKSGTGWPSFYEPIEASKIAEDTDYHLGYARTEVMCGRCGGHLGHVFKDGPKPTGLRYCINAVSLDFKGK